MRPKATKCVQYRLTEVYTKFTHAEVTNTMSTVYTTLDYGYRHRNECTGMALVPRKCGVYKLDQECCKMCTIVNDLVTKYKLQKVSSAKRRCFSNEGQRLIDAVTAASDEGK